MAKKKKPKKKAMHYKRQIPLRKIRVYTYFSEEEYAALIKTVQKLEESERNVSKFCRDAIKDAIKRNALRKKRNNKILEEPFLHHMLARR